MLPFYLRPARLLALAGLAATIGCAPTYELGLKPARPTGFFADDREQALAVGDSVEVRLHFVRYEPTRVVFEAEYFNSTKRSLVINPADFSYEASRLLTPVPAPGRRVKRPKPLPGAEVTAAVAAASMALPLPPLPPRAVAAFDPEPEIIALSERAERAATKAARVDWLGIALGAASLATDVASVGKRETTTQFQSRGAIRNASVTYSTLSTAVKIGHALAAEAARQRTAELQEYALRKVMLAPGYQVKGYLYFPRYDAADGLVVQAPVGSRTVPLEFAQTRWRWRRR